MRSPETGWSVKTKYPGVQSLGDGRYRLRAAWKSPKTGKRVELDRVVHATNAADAPEQRAALKAQAHNKGPVVRPRVSDCLRTWMRSKHGELKPSTRRHYATALEKYVLPTFGDYYVDAVTRADVLEWRDAQSGGPVTVNGRLRVLKNAFGEVCRDLGIANPTERVATLREPKSEGKKVLTAAELAQLLSAVREGSPQWYPLVLALALTGARFGEVTALSWMDIDEDAGVIRIVRAQWHGKVDTTKTDTARTIPLAPELAEALRAQRRVLEQRVGIGPIDRWIFPSEVGTLPRTTVLRKPLAKAAKEIGLGTRVPSNHWFRHTFNDLLRQTTTGQVQRAITGHVTEAMSEHYSHVAMGEKREALGRVLRLVGSSPTGQGGASGDPSGDRGPETKKALGR